MSGGDPTPLTTLDASAGEVDHVWPSVLSGGGILYGVRFSTGDEEIRFLSDGEPRTVLPGASVAQYTNGWLLYGAGSSLFAVEFDPTEGTTAGEPVQILDDLLFGDRPAFEVADDGTLAYVAQSTLPNQRVLVRVDRDGASRVVYSGEHRFEHPRLSPVDSTLLFARRSRGHLDVRCIFGGPTSADRRRGKRQSDLGAGQPGDLSVRPGRGREPLHQVGGRAARRPAASCVGAVTVARRGDPGRPHSRLLPVGADDQRGHLEGSAWMRTRSRSSCWETSS